MSYESLVMPERGTQFVADQLNLFQPGGQILPTLLLLAPQFFLPSGITEFKFPSYYLHSCGPFQFVLCKNVLWFWFSLASWIPSLKANICCNLDFSWSEIIHRKALKKIPSPNSIWALLYKKIYLWFFLIR